MANVLRSISQVGTTEPFELQVSRGQIYLHENICPYGINADIGTSSETVWAEGGIYTYPSAATVMKVSSSSADDAAAGTGARTVLISGLDADYNEISETVTLDGQDEVETTNEFLRINEAFVLTAGSGKGNAGNIYIGTGTVTTGKPATVFGILPTSAGRLEQAVYTVPANHSAYIHKFVFSSFNATAGAATFGQLWTLTPAGVYVLATTVRIAGTETYECSAHNPFKVPEKTDIEYRSSASSGSANVSAQIQMTVLNETVAG